MPKYYCDYCDTYLTHDSPSVRKTHNGGRKHKDCVKAFYQTWLDEQIQKMVEASGGVYVPPPGGNMVPPPGILAAATGKSPLAIGRGLPPGMMRPGMFPPGFRPPGMGMLPFRPGMPPPMGMIPGMGAPFGMPPPMGMMGPPGLPAVPPGAPPTANGNAFPVPPQSQA